MSTSVMRLPVESEQQRMGTDDANQREIAITLTQTIAPPNGRQRFEGIAFSTLGDRIGVATSDTNTVYVFRRKPDEYFGDTPESAITGPESRMKYPHDLSFTRLGDTEFLAVAQRAGAICLYQWDRAMSAFTTKPVFEIRGWTSKLSFCDGVSFVPPDDQYVAACSWRKSRITFYRRTTPSSMSFDSRPVFELKHPVIARPDGLAFSPCGRWLAVANHGKHTVSIHERRTVNGRLEYGPEPLTVIKDDGLRYPHSVAFSPEANHLIVTNAGANYFSVYRSRNSLQSGWSQSPAVQQIVGPENIFQKVNARNKMEGGPKGIAIYKNTVAVCSPEHGIKIYSFFER